MGAAEVVWNPVTKEEQLVKEAFETLNISNDKVVIQTPPGKPNQFILQSKGYFDLQGYVLTGKDFPKTNGEFEGLMPKKAFRKLTDIDSEIYEKTKNTIVAIGSTCSDYHANHLSKLVTAGSAAINYSESTVELLEEAEDINLRHQLNVLLDPKYKTQADLDAIFEQAKEGAQLTLSMLKDQAQEKEAEVKAILQSLLAFKDNTMKHLKDVQHLTKQYQTGPVENTSDQKKPYLEYLNAKLKKDSDDFWDVLREYNEKYDGFKQATAIAVGLCFAGPFGWIGVRFKAAEAAKLRKAFNTLKAQIEKLKQDREEETNLIYFVNQLIKQFDDIDDKMITAITAMKELGQLFNEQANCYDKIAGYLNGMKTGTDAKSLANRRPFIDHNMKQTIKKLKELKDVAEEFTRNIINQVTL